jgi:hypothetical protein
MQPWPFLQATLTDECDAMCRKRLGVLQSADCAGVPTTWMCESFDNTNNTNVSAVLIISAHRQSASPQAPHIVPPTVEFLILMRPSPHGVVAELAETNPRFLSLTPLKMESDVGFPNPTIPSASGNPTAAQNHHRASRMLFTAKNHSWIILLGMLSQEFRQSTEARRAVSSCRGHRRLE